MVDIAAGQNTTFFIARPPPTEAAKEEAKKLESVATSTSEPAPAPASAAGEAAADSPSSSAFKPSIDLSGFGFAFGAPPASASTVSQTTVEEKAASPGISDEQRKKNAVGISRTIQSAWEELPRFPPIDDVEEECVICKKVENEGKGDSLECEKVSDSFEQLLSRRLTDGFAKRAVRRSFPPRMLELDGGS